MPNFSPQPVNAFQNFLAGTQARQQEEQTATRHAMMQRQQEMQEQQFQQQQQEQARAQQFNQLAGEFLGPQTVEMAGGLQPGQDPSQQPPQRPSLSQLAALDPQRAMQLQQFQAQQQAAAQEQQVRQAREVATRAQYVLRSDSPATLIKVGFPDFVKQLEAQGMDIDSLDDNEARRLAQNVLTQFGPIAGIEPTGADGDQFTLGEGQVRFDARGRPIASVAPKPSDKDPTDQTFTRANVLRDEFNAASKDYGTVKASYDVITATAKEPSAAGDISLLTAYMKMVDPGSTVREGEFATAENAGGVPQRIISKYNSLLNGQRLEESQRKDFVNQAKNIYQSRDAQYKQTRKKYSTLAKRAEVDPIDVVGEEEVVAESSAAPQGNAPAAALQYLQANPQFKDAFRAKYGYLPAGV